MITKKLIQAEIKRLGATGDGAKALEMLAEMAPRFGPGDQVWFTDAHRRGYSYSFISEVVATASGTTYRLRHRQYFDRPVLDSDLYETEADAIAAYNSPLPTQTV